MTRRVTASPISTLTKLIPIAWTHACASAGQEIKTLAAGTLIAEFFITGTLIAGILITGIPMAGGLPIDVAAVDVRGVNSCAVDESLSV